MDFKINNFEALGRSNNIINVLQMRVVIVSKVDVDNLRISSVVINVGCKLLNIVRLFIQNSYDVLP